MCPHDKNTNKKSENIRIWIKFIFYAPFFYILDCIHYSFSTWCPLKSHKKSNIPAAGFVWGCITFSWSPSIKVLYEYCNMFQGDLEEKRRFAKLLIRKLQIKSMLRTKNILRYQQQDFSLLERSIVLNNIWIHFSYFIVLIAREHCSEAATRGVL